MSWTTDYEVTSPTTGPRPEVAASSLKGTHPGGDRSRSRAIRPEALIEIKGSRHYGCVKLRRPPISTISRRAGPRQGGNGTAEGTRGSEYSTQQEKA